jgi:hypothetical protein
MDQINESTDKNILKLYIKIFMGGLGIGLIMGEVLTLLVVLMYMSYEFNVHNTFYEQIPKELRNKYNSKVSVLLKYLADIIHRCEFNSHNDEQHVE